MSAQTIDPRAPFEELALPEGLQVGEYVLEDKLGEGGFGSVYRARHPLIGKLAAIKVLSRKYSADPEIVSRFVSEARAVNQIRHRNIVDIFAFGQLEDGRSYFVMELLDGVPLDAHIREQGGVALDEAIPILRAIARALDAAHAKGIAHRDLKPENIILARGDDGEMFPKLLDFGIAKLVGENGFSTKHKTRTGTPIGTPFYMSPEQARGEAVDHRTDIYSFGCVAYELLTGKVPFDGDNHLTIMMKQCTDEPIAPSVRAAENPELLPLPEGVDNAIAWLMHKEPSARPASLAIAMQTLEEAGGIAPSRPTPFPTVRSGPVRAPSNPGRTTSPSQRGQTAFAQTVAGDPAMLPAPAAPPAKSRRGIAIVVGALAVAGAAVGGFVLATSAPETPPVVAPAPQQPPPAAPTPPPAPPEHVTIRIDGAPAGTEVFGPSGPVGRAPGEIQLVRGDAELQLTLQAKGYETQTIKVSPKESGSVTVALEPKQVAAVEKPPTKPTTKPTKPIAKPIAKPPTKPITKSDPKGSGAPPAPDPWTRN